MIVVTVVSLRVGHVTFCASARTSCMNLNGLTFAITLSSGFPAQFLRTRPAAGSFWGLGSSRKSVTGPLTMCVTYCRSDESSRERQSPRRLKRLRPGGQSGWGEAAAGGQLTMEELALAGVEGLEPPTPGF